MEQHSAKRQYPRKSFKKPVAFLSQGVSQVAQGVEIGEGGISFLTDFVLDEKHPVVVNFFIPNGGFFTLRGDVRSAVKIGESSTMNQAGGQFTYGLSFNEVSLSLKRQIRAYVARMSLNNN